MKTSAFDATRSAAEFPPLEPLLRLKSILVPVDFSECSRKALAYAAPFAKQFGADITLLHVVEPYVPVPEMSTIDWDLIQTRIREAGETGLARLKESIAGYIPVQTELRMGRPDREIVEYAKEFGVDLIILSTHGRTGLAHVFMGSTAEKVVRHAPCPALIVREHEHDFVRSPATA